ncbi:MAG: glycosyltransferase family 2 protein [Candidatus Blackburnbacteria bacterium]|nr:glycosyltransferase family 2 protein [Candidatus Blackburnbacteria bacterium]
MKIVVIIPTYNERENIGRMLDILVKDEFSKIKNHKMEVLVVDGQSPDGTSEVVNEKMKKYKQVNLLLTNKGGLGADYAKGMKYAIEKMKADAVFEFDADFQHDPGDIKRLVAAMDLGADYVIGSRYIPGGAIPKEWGMHRKFLSFFGSLFARVVLLMLNVHDMTSGFKLTKTEFLKKVDLDHLLSRYYAYKIHILHDVVKLGAKIVEVPIVFYERKEGSSKISRKDLFDSFRVVILLRLRDSKRFIKFGIVGTVGYMLNALGLEFFSGVKVTQDLANFFLEWKGSWPLSIASEPSAWAAAFAAEVAILSNFILNNYWTFASKRITNPLRFLWKFSHFNLTSAGAVVIQFLVVGLAVSLFGDTPLVRQLSLVVAVGVFIVPYNYTMYNVFIWKTWKVPGLRWLQNRRVD